MGPPVPIGNNCTPGPSVIIEDIHNMGPWSAGPSDTGYYVGRVARMIRNLSLKGLIVQPIACGVPEVVLPQLSTIVVRTPQVPRSPGSPKKQNFGPASKTAGSHPEVLKSPISRPEATQSS
ncbi:hypothetical protein EDD22DRAFT_958368 [Suillus occidentalis]|nr:hypothetical protein EDD22DRAFT_958368 [Suillus occidentalis]